MPGGIARWAWRRIKREPLLTHSLKGYGQYGDLGNLLCCFLPGWPRMARWFFCLTLERDLVPLAIPGKRSLHLSIEAFRSGCTKQPLSVRSWDI